MKKILTLGIAIMITFAVSAQQDVTKFMGIPVDGTKAEMIQQLKTKGFTYKSTYDRLEGEFNGRDVYLYIVTNHNKVYRIMVQDQIYTTAGSIKIRYNNLCDQFKKNEKYIATNLLGYSIDEEEDISYEMSVHEKRYQASYCQLTGAIEEQDTTGFTKWALNYILDQYGEKWDTMSNDDQEKALLLCGANFIIEKNFNKSVWFMIHRTGGEYRIVMYYDNKLNEANGEDL